MESSFGREAQEWIQAAIGGVVAPLEFTRLKGSTSSSLYVVSRAGRTARRFVLRVLDNSEWLAEEPDLAEHEAAALEEARQAGLNAPELVAYSSKEVGFAAPVVLMSFLDGRIDIRPEHPERWIETLAQELAAIHRHDAPGFPWTFRSWTSREVTAPPEWSQRPDLWEQALQIFTAGEPRYDPCFIHRDYHPMNVLWEGGRIPGVVDWINACRGPASVDVAHCRTNLASMFGVDAAEQFLQSYLASSGQPFDPYWDVDSLIDMCFPQPSWYSPWSDFGLTPIDQQTLCHQIDDYLASVLRRFHSG